MEKKRVQKKKKEKFWYTTNIIIKLLYTTNCRFWFFFFFFFLFFSPCYTAIDKQASIDAAAEIKENTLLKPKTTVLLAGFKPWCPDPYGRQHRLSAAQ